MKLGRYFWKLFLGNALLLGLVLSASVLLIVREFDRFHLQELTEHLETLAEALAPTVEGKLSPVCTKELDALAKHVGSSEPEGIRITFVTADGLVLGDSQASPASMESHHDRPEIIDALTNGSGACIRWSHTLTRETRYVAMRIGPANAPEGVIRVAMGVNSIGARTKSARELMWTIAILSLAAAVVLALGLARTWSRRIAGITAAAQCISEGDLTARVNTAGKDEVASLAIALNQMRTNLAGQLLTIERQNRMLESLLGRLKDGVVVIDSKAKIILINPAAITMLDIKRDPSELVGEPVEQAISIHELQRMLLARLHQENTEHSPTRSEAAQETQMNLQLAEGRISVIASVTELALPDFEKPISDPDSAVRTSKGRLLTLTDITELAQTIQMKSDFVTNASHQLRTPLSVIRASVETLLSMDLAGDTEASARFIDVLDRHSSRLEAMVADLLSLSRVETPSSHFAPETIDIRAYLAELRARWSDLARNRKIKWDCVAQEACLSHVNPELLTLIMDNLVDNALKFTPEEGSVVASARVADSCQVAIEVCDTGCGIANEEQERVFERFYQAKITSGASSPHTHGVPGTGLGLSIVKHAVTAIGGELELESTVRKGTKITIFLPRST